MRPERCSQCFRTKGDFQLATQSPSTLVKQFGELHHTWTVDIASYLGINGRRHPVHTYLVHQLLLSVACGEIPGTQSVSPLLLSAPKQAHNTHYHHPYNQRQSARTVDFFCIFRSKKRRCLGEVMLICFKLPYLTDRYHHPFRNLITSICDVDVGKHLQRGTIRNTRTPVLAGFLTWVVMECCRNMILFMNFYEYDPAEFGCPVTFGVYLSNVQVHAIPQRRNAELQCRNSVDKCPDISDTSCIYFHCPHNTTRKVRRCSSVEFQ